MTKKEREQLDELDDLISATHDAMTRMGVPLPKNLNRPRDAMLAWRLAWLEGHVAQLRHLLHPGEPS